MAGRPQKHRDNKTFIANRLDKLLAGKSFAEFERKCQLPVTTVRRIMNGTDPTISTLTKIAKACGITLDYFFEDDASQKKSPPAKASGAREVNTELLEAVYLTTDALVHFGRHLASGVQREDDYSKQDAVHDALQKLLKQIVSSPQYRGTQNHSA